MAAGSTDGCAVPAGEEVEVAGIVTVHIIQKDCTIASTKTVMIREEYVIHVGLHYFQFRL